jgi:hypothetical protein
VGYRRWEFGAEPKGIGSGKVKGMKVQGGENLEAVWLKVRR